MLRFLAGSIAVAVAPFVLFFAFCNFLSSHPSLAQSTGLLQRMASIAYGGRDIPIQFRPDCTRYDARVTYLLRPGRCRFDAVEFDTVVDVNSFGLRDDEESLTTPEIIVLGDSHAMGQGVQDQESFAQILERSLGRKVLNAGISSFGTARELMLLRLLDTSAARVIVIQYCANDVAENQMLLQRGTLPILAEKGYQALIQQAQAYSRNWLFPGLRVFRQFGNKTTNLVRQSRSVDGNILEVEAFHNALAGATDLLRGRHVVILELNGFRGLNARFINAARSRLTDLGLDLTLVDVSTILTPQDYFVLDAHMRPSGHEKVAALLAQAIGSRTEASGDARDRDLSRGRSITPSPLIRTASPFNS
jgi:lysophospholipase L1-like esterase